MEKGISTIELMLTVGLMAIVSAFSVPSFHALLNNQRATATAALLHHSIQLTRHHAVSTGQVTRLVPNTADWSSGWTVQTGTGEGIRIIHHQPATKARILRSSTLASRIEYRPSGRAILASGGFQAGTFNVCVPGSLKSHDLIISRVGRLRRSTAAVNRNCSTGA